MELGKVIEKRKSIRVYSGRAVEQEKITSILNAGIKAPSGKNGQPWRFIIVQQDKELLSQISGLTIYDSFVKTADCLILVFLEKTQSYNYIKDVQAIGACIQNMLLAITDLGLAACWIGEILNRDLYVRELLNLSKSLDLMAVLTIGYPSSEAKQPYKKTLEDFVLSMC